MNLKTKIAAMSTLLILQSFSVNAAPVDDEIAVVAAEQDKTGEQVVTFDPNSVDADKRKPKTKDEIKAEEKRLEEERKEARKKIKEERKKSRDELSGKTPISKNPVPATRTPRDTAAPADTPPETPAVTEPPAPVTPPVTDTPALVTPPIEIPAPVTQPVTDTPAPVPIQPQVSNPVANFASFNDIVQAVQFTPLYIPKKSGYDVVSMATLDDNIVEIRYKRKWEQNVILHVRTYRRADGEQVKDISGVHGVKWRINAANGITTYIAKIEETKHVAAWAVGRYTFSAYVENLSFASFHSLIVDELVDISQHYYLGY